MAVKTETGACKEPGIHAASPGDWLNRRRFKFQYHPKNLRRLCNLARLPVAAARCGAAGPVSPTPLDSVRVPLVISGDRKCFRYPEIVLRRISEMAWQEVAFRRLRVPVEADAASVRGSILSN